MAENLNFESSIIEKRFLWLLFLLSLSFLFDNKKLKMCYLFASYY